MTKRLGQKPRVELLWHGTTNTEPELIYTSLEGFDMRMGRDDAMWGKAVYFAEQASYSLTFYAYSASGCKQIFLAEVLIGDCVDYPQGNYKKPPEKKQGSKEEYDSIRGHTRGSDVYMVYANQKCYPRYLVTFQ